MRLGLGARIFIGMIAGTIIGAALGERATVIQPLADLFIRILVLAAVPLVFFNLLAGLTTLTDLRTLGRLTAKILSYFFATKTLAVLLGVVAMRVFRPGVGMTAGTAPPQNVAAMPSVTQVLLDMVPVNAVRAFSDGNIAQIVVLSVFLGIATLLLNDEPRDRLRAVFADVAALLRKLVEMILLVAPIGIGALMAVTVGRYGAELFGPVARFVAGAYAAYVVMVALYLLLLRVFTAQPPLGFLRRTGTLWATTAATTSSLASLPVALESAETLRLPRSIYTYTLPLGIQINKDGTAILLAAIVVFTAQAAGVRLSTADLVTTMLLSMLLSAGSGGIPSGGFVIALIIVEAMHLPLELAAIIGGIYRLVDMGGTTVNVMGNMVGTILVSHSEGGLDRHDLS